MIAVESTLGKTISSLHELAEELEFFARSSANAGQSQYEVEKGILGRVLQMGHTAMNLYLDLQGNGDLGPTVETAAGKRLLRSEELLSRPLRTIFGEHTINAYVYAAGPKEKIELRPIDARLALPAGKHSYLYEEFAQYFCVEQAFGTAQARLATVFGAATSVDSLEHINQRMGGQAAVFLDALPVPPASEEKALLVVTADDKGVPLVKNDLAKVPAFEKRERPGNRRMATLACVYTVAPHVRTADQILAALFREESATPPGPRPEPAFKQLLGRFGKVYQDGDELVEVAGAIEAFSWVRQQVDGRHQPGQPLIRLLDGQPSLRDAAEVCLGDLADVTIIDILDIVHVSGYVWRAAKVFERTHEHREAFVWDRLGRILRGDVRGVTCGLRRMATLRGLKGADLKEVHTVCGYFDNNAERMRYDEYLAAGYPIATGVIEGACRHLVKDRLERSGMRWTLASAQAMLHVRAVVSSSYWEDFNRTRMATEQASLHPHARMLADYQPPTLAV